MQITTKDVNKINEIIHQLKWNGGLKVTDSADFPALDYFEITVEGQYVIDDPIEFKEFIIEHEEELHLNAYIDKNLNDATNQLSIELNDLAQDGILSYAKGIHLTNRHVEYED